MMAPSSCEAIPFGAVPWHGDHSQPVLFFLQKDGEQKELLHSALWQ